MTPNVQGQIKAKIAREAAKYEVQVSGQWQSVQAAARPTPNGWLNVKLLNGDAVVMPPNLWRRKFSTRNSLTETQA